MKTNLIKEKSFAFALKVIKISESMRNESKEFVLSKQLLRSGTAVGALVRDRTCKLISFTSCIPLKSE
ncbi:MAG: four helix bundle protein [Ignavibacteria bacterium]|nr:four helix bundle protein [Ignavibacteria bacterium]